MADKSRQIRYDDRDENGDACCERVRVPVPARPLLGRHPSSPSDEKEWISRSRTIAVGETNVCKHAIIHVPSVAAESQTTHPKMKRKFPLKGVNLIECIAHDSLPTPRNLTPSAYCGLVARDVIYSTKIALSSAVGGQSGFLISSASRFQIYWTPPAALVPNVGGALASPGAS